MKLLAMNSLRVPFSLAIAQSLYDVLSAHPELSDFTALLAQEPSVLTNLDNITLLAPNNEAVARLMNGTEGLTITNNSDYLKALLSYHILDGVAASFESGAFVTTALQPGPFARVSGGQRVLAHREDSGVIFTSGLLKTARTVGNASVFDRGVVYALDNALNLPLNISATSVALNLTSAVGDVSVLGMLDMIDAMSDVTKFVPTDDAIRRVAASLTKMTTEALTAVVSYHIIPAKVWYKNVTDPDVGLTLFKSLTNTTVEVQTPADGDGSSYVNNAKILQPNILTANGVVHVIDRVLNPENSTLVPAPGTTIDAFPNAVLATGDSFSSMTATANVGQAGTGSQPPRETVTNIGAIAGAIAGGICVLVLVIALLWHFKIKTRKSRSSLSRHETYNGKPELPTQEVDSTFIFPWHNPEFLVSENTMVCSCAELELNEVPSELSVKPDCCHELEGSSHRSHAHTATTFMKQNSEARHPEGASIWRPAVGHGRRTP